jgi:[ribosomal protein S5]-alanine N-acetyltransferase
MEKMPYRDELQQAVVLSPTTETVVSTDWHQGLPTLRGRQVVLRELRVSDAPSLFALLTTEEVSRFISPPPSTVDGFERFIGWTLRQRAAGTYACFAVTVTGYDTAIGIFQVRSSEASFGTAEWGFAIGSDFWGTGVFQEGAVLVLDFAFDTIGVHRLEARAAVKNGRGNSALLKMGATQECRLRKTASTSIRCSTRCSTPTGAARVRRSPHHLSACTRESARGSPGASFVVVLRAGRMCRPVSFSSRMPGSVRA